MQTGLGAGCKDKAPGFPGPFFVPRERLQPGQVHVGLGGWTHKLAFLQAGVLPFVVRDRRRRNRFLLG